MDFAYNNSVSVATGLAPNEVHINHFSRVPFTIVEQHYARGHQSLDRDHLVHCNLAADRQRRAYALVREQHALEVSRVERRNSELFGGLKHFRIYTTGG